MRGVVGIAIRGGRREKVRGKKMKGERLWM
jgi:hypothetical protein